MQPKPESPSEAVRARQMAQPGFDLERRIRIKHMYTVERKTMQEIANELGISRQRVHQLCVLEGAGLGGMRITPEMVRDALKRDGRVRTMTGLARAIGNRSVNGLRYMLARTGMLPGVARLFRIRRYAALDERYTNTIAQYSSLVARYGRPLSVEELRKEGLNARRLQRVFGKNYMRKLRTACGEPPRKPRPRMAHEEKPIAAEQPATQEAGV